MHFCAYIFNESLLQHAYRRALRQGKHLSKNYRHVAHVL